MYDKKSTLRQQVLEHTRQLKILYVRKYLLRPLPYIKIYSAPAAFKNTNHQIIRPRIYPAKIGKTGDFRSRLYDYHLFCFFRLYLLVYEEEYYHKYCAYCCQYVKFCLNRSENYIYINIFKHTVEVVA